MTSDKSQHFYFTLSSTNVPTGLAQGDVNFVLSSSSTYEDSAEFFGPELAWDGTKTFFSDGFFKSKVENNPWFRIDYSPSAELYGMIIRNRKDCCGEELRNVEVRAGMSPDMNTNPVVGTFKGPGVSNSDHYVDFGGKIAMKHLRFQIIGSGATLQINGIFPNYFPGIIIYRILLPFSSA